MTYLQTEQSIIEKIVLKEYETYYISVGKNQEVYILYCSPVYEKNFFQFNIQKTQEILIGNSERANIIYKNPLVNNIHARMFSYDGIWKIENLDYKTGVFVNGKAVTNDAQVLQNGDVIFLLGLKIIKLGNSLLMNNPNGSVTYSKQTMLLTKPMEYNMQNVKAIDEESDTEEEIKYFSRAPRITKLIEKETVKIDNPPGLQNREQMPAILTIGSTLSMGAIMLMSASSSISGLVNRTMTLKEASPSLIVAFLMLVSIVVFPVLTIRYEKKQKIKYEEKRQRRYKKYIDKKAELIDEIMEKQRNILFENYVSPEECKNIILNKKPRLWERKIEDYDFASIRLGMGDVPLEIDIQYPEESFAMEDDNLVEILNTIGNKSKILKNAPISLSLVENNISALIGQDTKKMKEFMKNIILQLIAFQSYEELKLVFFIKEDKDKYWEFVKMLPHTWDDQKQIRYFADNFSDMKELSKYIEQDLQARLQHNEREFDYKSFMPYYLIITDSPKEVENIKIVSEILEKDKNLGFSILAMANNIMELPNECKTFITVDGETGMVFESELSSTNQRQFIFDRIPAINFTKVNQILSNIPIRYTTVSGRMLPSSYSFLEMYDVGRVEQLNVLERWNKNDSTLSLQAPIGIDTGGMKISLDVHEKFHGPHGLIAGSTGSGKSEFIITYILSLAINYHPYDVNFMLIDYKGGGLAGAFKKRDIKLPHLVGTITNIDTVGLHRSLDSIQSELRRRQVMFNEARNMIDESTIDIYKYQKLYHDGIVKKPIPHLLIICDEFAELKQQQEDFMDELISVARIGRSLRSTFNFGNTKTSRNSK